MPNMSEDNTISFPCVYPIKVIGADTDQFATQVLEIIATHDTTVDASKVSEKTSQSGKYRSLTIELFATGEPHIRAIFEALRRLPQVKLVL